MHTKKCDDSNKRINKESFLINLFIKMKLNVLNCLLPHLFYALVKEHKINVHDSPLSLLKYINLFVEILKLFVYIKYKF